MSVLSKLDFNILKKIWILISFISVITISFFAYKIFPIEKFKIIYPLLIFFSFGSISFSAMTTGNISNVIYPILAFSLFSLHKDYKFIFSLIILKSVRDPVTLDIWVKEINLVLELILLLKSL